MAHAILHPSIVSLVSLAASIAANHPGKGLCQLDKLKQFGVSDEQIDLVIDIARHIRDEAGQKIDAQFDAIYDEKISDETDASAPAATSSCCSSTGTGKACC
ncbi:hypothetical protein [Sulfuriferula nivalis]|uniref:Uncharacterized protein n=1 Tax=Sulfuriferula nivalis TaxID=2675298 RepID=A0A809SD38_9PROT|nr:hypothetical protein [Sulfuriferula nivalis]BBP00307.1 hypothetical protein SFSGTM_10150 [Sulfuriferula nivalis]